MERVSVMPRKFLPALPVLLARGLPTGRAGATASSGVGPLTRALQAEAPGDAASTGTLELSQDTVTSHDISRDAYRVSFFCSPMRLRFSAPTGRLRPHRLGEVPLVRNSSYDTQPESWLPDYVQQSNS
jgi:hypothetical protein